MKFMPEGQKHYSMQFRGVVTAFLFLFLSISTFAQDPNFHIYLCFGQSNMAGAGTIETQDQTVDPRFQVMYPMVGCSMLSRSFGNWYPAVPPLWGCPSGGLGPSDYFGRTMVQKLPTNIKIGVIVIGIPGCDIRIFDKTGFQTFDTYNYVPSKYKGSAYAWLMELAKLAAKDGVIKGFLIHQGETMPDSTKWPGQVKRVCDSLVTDLKLPATIPIMVGEVLYTSAGGSSGGHNATIDTIARVIPNASVISAEGLTGKDQWHFVAASERIFGARYATKMLAAESTPIKNEKLTVGEQVSHLFSCVNGSVQIKLKGDFSYRITNICGTLLDAGRGTDALSTGVKLTSGIYILSVKRNTELFSGKIFLK